MADGRRRESLQDQTGGGADEFLPVGTVDAWRFNGGVPGPTIEVMEGDRLRLVVENGLPEPFSMRWHGLEVPILMDGAPEVSQDPIPPDGSFTYGVIGVTLARQQLFTVTTRTAALPLAQDKTRENSGDAVAASGLHDVCGD